MAPSALMSNISASKGGTLSPEMQRTVELELEAICSDAQFRTSQRNCAFLRYVIRETLAGRADEIKERTLGKELFGRPISYDTGSDAVVRVRANELRKRLICYYETHQSQAGWRIHLPLRTYVPEFTREDALNLESDKAPLAFRPPATPHPVEPAAAQSISIPPVAATASPEDVPEESIPASWFDNHALTLPVSRMMIPTVIALFLCLATFRWQAAYGTPYLDFWETLLSSRTGIAVVLDADPADPRAVMTSDLQMIQPLLQTAARLHANTEISSSAAASHTNPESLLTVHVTHRSPQNKESSNAAYVTVIPGDRAQLWVGSEDARALGLAIHSLSDDDFFPAALQVAVRRNTPTRVRLAENQQVTALTLPSPPRAGEAQW